MTSSDRSPLVLLALVVAVVAVYWPVGGHEFLTYDDGLYVYENPEVLRGLDWEGVRWAFTSAHAGIWHPLTWLSHMLDVELFGMDAGGHHLTSVWLHALTGVLLFCFLRRSTKASWPSVFVTALFLVHPLRVESVAWVSERKDVLAGLFWMLTLLAYARYVERPGPGRYLVVLVGLASGLLSKPMVVTLPCVLLLLDGWPLDRWHAASWRRVVVEKLPMFALVAITSLVTLQVQRAGGAVSSLDAVPFGMRLSNAFVSYVLYLAQTVWPASMAALYPHPAALARGAAPVLTGTGIAAGLALLGITGLVVWAGRLRGYLLTGWLWYLGTLVPVIGIVQVGIQSRADRYTYLPLIGIYLMLAWGARDLLAWQPRIRNALVAVAIAAVVCCMMVTRVQVWHWRDSRSVYEHAIAVTDDNYLAYYNLASLLSERGEFEDSLDSYARALAIKPDLHLASSGLGHALLVLGRRAEARQHVERALELKPDHAEARNNLGRLLAMDGDYEGARAQFEQALRSDPQMASAHNNLGNLSVIARDYPRAVASYDEALQLDPNNLSAHENLGQVHQRLGDARRAVHHYQWAMRLGSEKLEVLDGLAWIHATHPDASLRSGVEAVRMAQTAARLSQHRDARILRTLAAAHAESGNFEQAIAWQGRALELASPARRSGYARELALFEAGEKLRHP